MQAYIPRLVVRIVILQLMLDIEGRVLIGIVGVGIHGTRGGLSVV